MSNLFFRRVETSSALGELKFIFFINFGRGFIGGGAAVTAMAFP